MSPEDYTIADIDKLEAEVRAAIPQARIERWMDFGFRMDVAVGSRFCIACQPPRDETDEFAGQPGVFRSVDEIKRYLRLQ